MTKYVQKCPRNTTMNKKIVQILREKGLNFKLKHRNAQKSILSGRFVDLYGRVGNQYCSQDTPGQSGRIDIYAPSSLTCISLIYKYSCN